MNALKNLRKQISRVSRTKSFRQRDVEIFKLLILLSKKDFTYQPEIIKKHFSFIKESKLFWQPVSAELIPFEDLLAIKYPELKVIE